MFGPLPILRHQVHRHQHIQSVTSSGRRFRKVVESSHEPVHSGRSCSQALQGIASPPLDPDTELRLAQNFLLQD